MQGSVDDVAAALPAYEIGEELGRGAWGVVLAGRHRRLGREVAIKQLPAQFASDPDVRARFLAEGRRLASLDHPHGRGALRGNARHVTYRTERLGKPADGAPTQAPPLAPVAPG